MSGFHILLLGFLILLAINLISIFKFGFKGRQVSSLITRSQEISSMLDEKISPDLTKLLQFIEFQKKFQGSQQDAFENLVRHELNAINRRLDDLFDELVTQQTARYKVNDLLASKIRDDPE
jgi:hypothetical protein